MDCSRQNRVSPWEIEPIGSVSGSHSLSASSSKRIKICLPTINPDFPVPSKVVTPLFAKPFSYYIISFYLNVFYKISSLQFADGVDSTEAGEYARFHKVLQGQEFMGFKARNAVSLSSSQLNMERCSTDRSGCSLASLRSAFGVPVANSNFTRQCAGFGESIRFDKVLQGQEFPSLPPFKGGSVDAYSRNGGFDAFNGEYASGTNRWSGPVHVYASFAQPSTPPSQASSPSSVLMFKQANYRIPHHQIVHRGAKDKDVSQLDSLNPSGTFRGLSLLIDEHFEMGKVQDTVNVARPLNNKKIDTNDCKLFGFSLSKRTPVTVETEFATSKEHMLKSPRRGFTTVSSPYALCVATL